MVTTVMRPMLKAEPLTAQQGGLHSSSSSRIQKVFQIVLPCPLPTLLLTLPVSAFPMLMILTRIVFLSPLLSIIK